MSTSFSNKKPKTKKTKVDNATKATKDMDFETGLEPVKPWTQASSYICGKCGKINNPTINYSSSCQACKYKVLYKIRPRYGMK